MTQTMAGTDDIFAQAAAWLRFQGELGLRAVECRSRQTRGEAQPASVDLLAMERDLVQCERCGLAARRTNVVFGGGSPTAAIMFVAEAPALEEDLQAAPLVGAAGELFDRMLAAMRLTRSEVYITHVLKCRPPRQRLVTPEEWAACEHILQAQMAAIKPRVVVTLGPTAARLLLRDGRDLHELRGVWRRYGDWAVMPTLHPAHLLAHPEAKRLVWRDLQAVMALLAAPQVKGG